MQSVYLVSSGHSVMACQRHLQQNILHPDRVLDVHDLVLVVRGTWDIRLDGVTYALQQGDCLLLPAHVHHDGVVRSSPECETMYVHFTPAAQDRLLSAEEDTPAPGMDAFLLPVHIPHAGEEVFSRFAQLITAYWSPGLYARVQADAHLALLLTELTQKAVDGQLLARKEVMIGKVLSMLEINQSRFYAASELAEACGVSTKTLQKYFQQVTGMPVRQYQLHRKLEKARSLLASAPETTLSSLAEQLGFCDEFHLSKQYKKKFGFSPRTKAP